MQFSSLGNLLELCAKTVNISVESLSVSLSLPNKYRTLCLAVRFRPFKKVIYFYVFILFLFCVCIN